MLLDFIGYSELLFLFVVGLTAIALTITGYTVPSWFLPLGLLIVSFPAAIYTYLAYNDGDTR